MHPANELIIHLYRLAAVDLRTGDCGALFGTLTPEGIGRVLDEHADMFPTAVARQQAFQLIWLLGQIVTKHKSIRESQERERKIKQAEQMADVRRRRRR